MTDENHRPGYYQFLEEAHSASREVDDFDLNDGNREEFAKLQEASNAAQVALLQYLFSKTVATLLAKEIIGEPSSQMGSNNGSQSEEK